jgi:hypothetical protein
MSDDRTLPVWLQVSVAVAQIIGAVAIPVVIVMVSNSFAARPSETQEAVDHSSWTN